MDDVTHDTRLHVKDEGTGNYLDGLEMRYSIRGEEDRLIAFAFSESNARRLAVCWNALQHIPTVELESGQLQNMVTLKRAAEAERDSLIRDAERYRWIRGGNRIGVKWCELYSGGQALDEAIDSTMKALPSVTAKARFDRAGGHEETDPIERLRFFCSQAMGGQDWLDVEPFFDDVIAERHGLSNKIYEQNQDIKLAESILSEQGFSESFTELKSHMNMKAANGILLSAARKAVLALAHVSQKNAMYQDDYKELDAAIREVTK